MHKTTIRFGDDTYGALRALARREGIPVSHMIREAVVVRLAVGVRPSDSAELRRDVDLIDERLRRIELALGRRRP